MEEDIVAREGSLAKSIGKFFWELLKAFLIAMIIIVPIRYFLIQPFFVRGASMEPTFDDGEYLVIDQLSYRLREVRRGEAVVFHPPVQESQFFIKRIIGLPGERVKVNNGQVIIFNQQHPDGVTLDESPYLPPTARTGGNADVQLGADDYFVLGDNRPASSDSRSWGSLDQRAIVGRVWIRAFPFDQVNFFSPNTPGFIETEPAFDSAGLL